jgi:nitrate reductase (cytochrome), electron transfer subunit
MNMKKLLFLCLSLSLQASPALAEEATPDHALATLRGGPIDLEPEPPKMADVENDDVKRARSYPMQPPTIPHQIRDYRVDLYSNKCLSCHSRKQTEQSQAPMISVTHYMDREGNFLADVSPRRYFCEQCHVAQTNAPALVGTDFKDIDQLLREQK